MSGPLAGIDHVLEPRLGKTLGKVSMSYRSPDRFINFFAIADYQGMSKPTYSLSVYPVA